MPIEVRWGALTGWKRLGCRGGQPAERFTNRPFAEYRAMDPEGNWFDLSEHGFGGPRPPSDSTRA
ncbi:hypothetical protein ACWD0Z_26605 [Streptomyces sp. NPDC003007]